MDVWKFSVCQFDKADIIKNGNRFLIGNGYLGIRGSMEEFGKTELCAINLAGVYDRNGDKWREPVNAPNALYFCASIDGVPLSVLENAPLAHNQNLDIKYGNHSRDTVFKEGSISSERFASMDNCHLICANYEIKPDKDGEIVIITGVSGDIWDINGPHLFGFTKSAGEIITASATTGELKIKVSVSEYIKAGFPYEESFLDTGCSLFRKIVFKAQAGKKYRFYKYISVTTGLGCKDPEAESIKAIGEAKIIGYESLKIRHNLAWENIWANSQVECGQEYAQQALNYSLYHLHSIAPRHSGSMSIPARGLSGQTYKGAVFWDTEIFMFPFFVHTEPKVARALISYRIETLTGALKKAREYGLRGAFYAWESQEGGTEGCTDYNVTDVFTGRPVRTYFRDKQIHISGDIAYAIGNYYDMTGDDSILLNGGAEVVFECARFYLSRAYQNIDTGAAEFLDVVGPDEYHERVNNNAFTNRLAKYCFDKAIEYSNYLSGKYPTEYSGLFHRLSYGADLEKIKSIAGLVYKPNIVNEVIEQFDGYFKLEACSLQTVRSRLLDPREYWGSSNGVAAHTQIIKQADVISMMHLFSGDFSEAEVRANWEYYEPRTEHGSSLSACMYALTACRVGRPDLAYEFFMKSATIDLTGEGKDWAGEVYIGGTHPAANGGAWLIAALGFAGLKVKNGVISLNPCLPKELAYLRFPVNIAGKKYIINIEEGSHSVTPV